ncbi:hypothetical protein ABIF68_000094 [Bradyrhizobium japonicum]
MVKIPFGCVINASPSLAVGLAGVFGFGRFAGRLSRRTDRVYFYSPVGRSKSPGYGHLKLPHLMIAVSAAEQQ